MADGRWQQMHDFNDTHSHRELSACQSTESVTESLKALQHSKHSRQQMMSTDTLLRISQAPKEQLSAHAFAGMAKVCPSAQSLADLCSY